MNNLPQNGSNKITTLDEDLSMYNEVKQNPNLSIKDKRDKVGEWIGNKTLQNRIKEHKEQIKQGNSFQNGS